MSDRRTFTLTVDLENAAFADPEELPDILRRVAQRVEDGLLEGSFMDSNGNTVGTFTTTP